MGIKCKWRTKGRYIEDKKYKKPEWRKERNFWSRKIMNEKKKRAKKRRKIHWRRKIKNEGNYIDEEKYRKHKSRNKGKYVKNRKMKWNIFRKENNGSMNE